MIYKVARNDVVRLIRTGEIGTVKGWADHEHFDANGTILQVQVSTEKVVQGNAKAFEFVAYAKPKKTTGRKVYGWVSLVLSVLFGVYIGWALVNEYGAPVSLGASLGFANLLAWLVALGYLVRPRRTRLKLPTSNKSYDEVIIGGPTRLGKGRPSTYHL